MEDALYILRGVSVSLQMFSSDIDANGAPSNLQNALMNQAALIDNAVSSLCKIQNEE